jgi:hypothetical protein
MIGNIRFVIRVPPEVYLFVLFVHFVGVVIGR